MGSSAYLFYDGFESTQTAETTHTLGHEAAPYVIAGVCLLLSFYTFWKAVWSSSDFYSELTDSVPSTPDSSKGSDSSINDFRKMGTSSLLERFTLTLRAPWGNGGSPAKTPPPAHSSIGDGDGDGAEVTVRVNHDV